MLFLILMSSCISNNFTTRNKGKREDISKAIQNPTSKDSKIIFENIDAKTALQKNDEGLLPIEEAIKARNIEATSLLMSVKDCRYPIYIYDKILNEGRVDIFKLIPEKHLSYKLLNKLKKRANKDLEKEFLKRIEATELERLIIEGRAHEIRSQSKEWVIANYRDKRGSIDKRKINTTEILCIYGDKLAKELIEKLKDDKKDIKEYLLFVASKLGNRSMVKWLLKSNLDINSRPDNNDGRTALAGAAFNGHKEVCELLLDRGAELNTSGEDEWEVLVLAAQGGHKDVCELLLNRGAKVNSIRGNKISALMLAAQNGYKEVCELLLKNGAEVNAINEGGWRALMLAAKNGHEKVCELLLKILKNY